jgi:DNA-binding Lrp family transcriptional regulator
MSTAGRAFGGSATRDFRDFACYFVAMPKAIVLVKTVVGTHSDVAARVAKVKGVQAAFPTYGRYDVVAAVDVPSLKALSALAREVGGKEGVVATETLVGLEE